MLTDICNSYWEVPIMLVPYSHWLLNCFLTIYHHFEIEVTLELFHQTFQITKIRVVSLGLINIS